MQKEWYSDYLLNKVEIRNKDCLDFLSNGYHACGFPVFFGVIVNKTSNIQHDDIFLAPAALMEKI